MWDLENRQNNMFDGGAHFYNTYQCSDNKYLAVGSLEPQFYSILLEKLELNDDKFQDQMNKEIWQELKDLIADKVSNPQDYGLPAWNEEKYNKEHIVLDIVQIHTLYFIDR